MNAIASLPRIVRFLKAEYRPGSSCPHCGADGARVFTFITEDGKQRGAMAGCIQLFPKSPIAREEMRLREKEERYARQGWKLNRRDTEALDACHAVAAGEMSENTALAIVRSAKAANSARYRGRR